MSTEQHSVPKTGLAAAKVLLAVVVLACLTGCGSASSGEAKNVILIVGDGMGAAHRDAVRLATVGLEGELAMDSLPHSGSIGTSPANGDLVVTDSAAGATAMATGVKTYNGAVGVGPDQRAVDTILEEAKGAGKATGLVTTSEVTDATPAAFAAHVTDRGDQDQIARQYMEDTTPNVILGGGRNYWGDDLIEQARESGYEYASDADELETIGGPRILGLFADEQMYTDNAEGQGDAYDPQVPLPQMTQKALETLSEDPEGFFLLAEEEAIDSMSHYNNTPLMIEAGQQLDETVKVAQSFTENNPDTLLIVAADHECGGLTIEGVDDEPGNGEDEPVPVAGSDRQFVADWTTGLHTGVNVPVTASGPGAERLAGVHENTYLYEVMADALFSQ